ncbi:MAG: RNA polymerase sigma factor [Patescibacteria group bacterium]
MDSKHFPDFYRTNVKRVYRFLFYRVGGSKEMAEDLTQDVFIKALGAFEGYDPAISQTSWIFTIARNHLINQLQKTRPNVDLEEIENTMWDAVDGAEKMALRHDQKRLFDAIAQLPAEDAQVVRLKYLEGWPYDDIAKELGKTAGSLRVQAYRALKELKKILKQK